MILGTRTCAWTRLYCRRIIQYISVLDSEADYSWLQRDSDKPLLVFSPLLAAFIFFRPLIKCWPLTQELIFSSLSAQQKSTLSSDPKGEWKCNWSWHRSTSATAVGMGQLLDMLGRVAPSDLSSWRDGKHVWLKKKDLHFKAWPIPS